MNRNSLPATTGSRSGDSGSGPATAGDGEAPSADLRLVPPALAVWATTAWVLVAPGWFLPVVICGLAGAAALLAPARWWHPLWWRPPGTVGTAGTTGTTGASRTTRASGTAGSPKAVGTSGTLGSVRLTGAAVLLCVVAAAGTAASSAADLRRGPVPELADRYGEATFEVEVRADPRRAPPRPGSGGTAPPLVLLDARVVLVDEPDGTVTRTRTPVLVTVDAGRAEDRWLEVLPSTRLRIAGRLSPPYGGRSDIAAVLRADGAAGPHGVARASAVQRFAGRLRGGLREATEGLSPDARALLPGLVVGDTSRVGPELREAFRATDLTHLLAVSGGNFVILLALLTGPPGTAQSAERRGLAPGLGLSLRTTAVLAAGLSIGFVVVCGPEPSVVRAAACGGIALLAMVTGRRRSLLPALAAAVLLLVLYDPWLSRSPGFLLSVLATGALLTVAPRWSGALRRVGVPGRPAEALAASAAAQAVCAPVVVVLAERVSLVAVPCNLLAEFAVAPATVLGFGALALSPVVPALAEASAWCAGWPVEWIARVARAGAALPGATVAWPGDGWRGAPLLLVVTLAVVVAGRWLLGHRWLASLCAVALVLTVVRPVPLTRLVTGWPPPGWRMVMCDVGQGDALVLAAGPASGVVVDAGPDPVRIDRCLRALGVTRVPLVLLTHFHADHVAGLSGVLRGRDVGVVETTGLAEPVAQAALVRRVTATAGVPLRQTVAGERRRAGPVDWEVLWPPGGESGTAGAQAVGAAGAAGVAREPNDASVTLLVRTGGLRMLLLGDLEPPAQRALARGPLGARSARVDVLKVAHHGSAFQDPELLARTGPSLALVSVGADNPYGHPSPRTVLALRKAGARVARTDRDGSVAVVGSDQDGAVAVATERGG
ncbi:ComEC/Rec2 family competence protein [Streptomyces sp. JNUCC 64]